MIYRFPQRIYYTGFMATGKSRLAELTAAALGWKFYDTDTWIAKKTGSSISEIFAQKGESAFRNYELEAVEELSKKRKAVIALGGGTVSQPAALEILQKSGMLINLWAKPETILERVNRKNTRPLLAGLSPEKKMRKIKQMLAERESLYAQADFSVESREDIPHHVLIKKILSRIKIESLRPLTVDLGERGYPIYINENVLDLARAAADKADLPQDYVIVTDVHLKETQRESLRHLSALFDRCRIFYFRTGEEEKSLGSVNRLITYLLKYQFSRRTTLIAFGGGIVGDMAGFAASIYLRGIPFVQIPTTLLSMVDSAVGGKTGVNHKLGKNLIGSFYQPRAVCIDPDILRTLPQEEFLSGLAEVIKYAVIWDKTFFDFLADQRIPLLARDSEILKRVIYRCLEIKAEVVSKDEKEKGLRAILNYGHTFGHAIEALGNYQGPPHGIAVSLGMRVAMRLSVLNGLSTPQAEKSQTDLLNDFGFPQTYSIDPHKAWEVMGLDKKVENTSRVYIVPREIGKVKRIRDCSPELVFTAWKAITGESHS